MFIMINAALFLIYDNFRIFLTSTVLLGSGFASRLAMGFSPTIYASSYRTFTVLIFCIIAVACYIYSDSLERGYIDLKSHKIIKCIAGALLICSMINTLFLVTI